MYCKTVFLFIIACFCLTHIHASFTSLTRSPPTLKTTIGKPRPTETTTATKKKLTRQEMQEYAWKLDQEIFHLSKDEFESAISTDTWMIFFGAKWCKFCQRMTPKWHKLQRHVFEKLGGYNFNVAKVDCTEDEDFCAKHGADGYPTILIFNKGLKMEEYEQEADLKEMFKFAKSMARKYYDINHDEL